MTPGYEGDGASDPTVDLLPPKIAASLTTPVEEEEAPKTPLPPGPVVDEGGVVASDDTAAAGERREDGTSSPPNSAVEDLAESGVRGFCAPAPMSIEPWGGGFFNGDEEDNTVEMEELSELPQEPGRHPPPPRVLTKLMSFLERRERGGGEGGDDGADANADADGAATSVGEETDPILPRGDEEGGGGGLKYSPPASWSIRRGGGVSGGGIDYSPPASWSVRRGGEGGGGGDGPEPREGRGGGRRDRISSLEMEVARHPTGGGTGGVRYSMESSYSLALFPTTPGLARYLLTLLILISHGLFLYGQFAPMWRLRADRDIDVWANATSKLSRRTMEAAGLPWRNHLVTRESGDVETFTYGFAVRSLWVAAGMESKFGPRLSAVLLVLFSGFWPHVKLVLLNLTFWFPRTERSRTSGLYWLSTLGKWSLADVLVVCIMIAVVHLDWDVDPVAIRDGASRELPLFIDLTRGMFTPVQICDRIMSFDCSNHGGVKCWACEHLIGEVYGHPNWAEGAGRDIINGMEVSGTGYATLRIAGMTGIYIFCLAATLSLLVGVAVDSLDHRARAESAKNRRSGGETGMETGRGTLTSVVNDEGRGAVTEDQDPVADALAARGHGSHLLPRARRAWLLQRVRGKEGGCCSSICGYVTLVLISLSTVALVWMAITRPTMERQVFGAGPYLMEKVLGVEWKQNFSLWSLMEVTGEAGGPDKFLMATFALFVVLGPLLRSALVVIDLVLPLGDVAQGALLNWINTLGAFCAWDVFFVSVFMVNLEMPSITNTIITRPECAVVSGNGSCLEVQFNLMGAIGLVLGGTALLLAVSTLAVRMGFRGLNPYRDGDRGGPYWCGCCPCSGFDNGGGRRDRARGFGCCRRSRLGRGRGRIPLWVDAHAYHLLERSGNSEDGMRDDVLDL